MKEISKVINPAGFVLILSVLMLVSPFVYSHSAERLISGNVRSDGDLGVLPGVSIQVKGSSLVSGTQEDGNFYIEVKPQDSVLVFSLPGYKNKEIKLTKAYEYQIFLEKRGN
jgi:hypothetical protein